MRTVIFGGSFNPPHAGHLRAARAAAEALKPDRLIFIPAFCPPHKEIEPGSPPPEERLLLIELVAQELPGAEVSDIEISRKGASYTADTLEQLADEYPGEELYLLMGADMFKSVQTWRDFGRIARLCSIAPISRREGELHAVEGHAALLREEYAAVVSVIVSEPLDISSTELRAMLPRGGGREFLSERVYERIIQKRLYGAKPQLLWLREKAAELLKPSRLPHVLGTELEAVALARRWRADPLEAAEAAILHDITKKLSEDEQLKLCEEYGIIATGADFSSPKLFHARTGAAMAVSRFGVSEEVRGAIEWHTMGRENMTLLEKIIYIADYIEPSRDFDGVDILRRLAYDDIDEAMILGLKMSFEDIAARGETPCGSSNRAYEYLLREKERKNEENKRQLQ